jgi:RNA polymerase sigma-70 factor (ECF subfamily)
MSLPRRRDTEPVRDSLDELRGYVFSIAYRMLGRVGEAEDIVQEALLRLHREREKGTEIASDKAFLTTVTTRLAIDELKSARARRELYVGEWLPEPIVGEERAPGPAETAQMRESISTAFLLVMETLSPVERAVFLLHDVFDYPFAEISEIVERSEANCRQIATRARSHIDAREPRFEASSEERDELARRFVAAITDGDVDGFVTLLADDVVLAGDGGGKATASPVPVVGHDKVAHFIRALLVRGARVGARVEPTTVNGSPGAMMLDADGALVGVMALEVAGGAVVGVYNQLNPDKLGHVGLPISSFNLKR